MNWNVRPVGASYFKREWLQECTEAPRGTVWCRAYDKAGTERTTEKRSPDATAAIKMGRDKDGNYYLAGDYCASFYDNEDKVYGRICERVGARDMIIEAQAFYDTSSCTIVFPIDPAAAGKFEYKESAKKLIELGFTVKSDPAPNNKSKLTKVSPFFSACENGMVYILKDTFDQDTYEYIMNELEKFNGERSTAERHDDYVDAVGSGFSYLSKSKLVKGFALPNFNIPTLKSTGVIKGLGGTFT